MVRNNKRKILSPHFNTEYNENIVKRRGTELQKNNMSFSMTRKCGEFGTTHIQQVNELYSERSYYGPAKYICRYCGASFWFEEWVKRDSTSRTNNIVYNLCHKGGKIRIPPFKPPPLMLAHLLDYRGGATSKKFLEKIR